MKQIKLTQDQVALVDDADYNWLNQWKWYAYRDKGGFYAVRNVRKDGRQHQILMHRMILGLEYKDGRESDHQNHNTLDNRRSNIRVCTRQENQMNRKSFSNTTSKYKGVSWHKLGRKWQAVIYLNGKLKHLGLFTLERDAALAYNKVAKRCFGRFAYLNHISFGEL